MACDNNLNQACGWNAWSKLDVFCKFIIQAASPVVVDANTTYYVKPLDVEQRMKKATAGSCATLPTATLAFPSMSDFVDPTSVNAAEPTITSAPAVIGGIVK